MPTELEPQIPNQEIIQRISEDLGVSERSVRRALTGKTKGVWGSAAVRIKRIEEMASGMNYRPNSAARAMAEGRFGAVALLLSTKAERSYLPPGLLAGITSKLAEAELHLIVSQLADEKFSSGLAVPKLLREWSADGMLIDYTDNIPSRLIQIIEKHGLPCVWINAFRESNSIYPDDEEAAARATRYLLDHGHKRIAFLDLAHEDDPEAHFSTHARREGYRKTMVAANLKSDVTQTLVDFPLRAAFLDEWMGRKPRPTAVLCYSGEESALMLAALRHGLHVPENLSVMSFAAVNIVAPGMVVDSMLIPEYELGRKSVEMLLQLLDSLGSPLPSVGVPLVQARGQTVAPPRR